MIHNKGPPVFVTFLFLYRNIPTAVLQDICQNSAVGQTIVASTRTREVHQTRTLKKAVWDFMHICINIRPRQIRIAPLASLLYCLVSDNFR